MSGVEGARKFKFDFDWAWRLAAMLKVNAERAMARRSKDFIQHFLWIFVVTSGNSAQIYAGAQLGFEEYTGRIHAPISPASAPSRAGNTLVPPPGIPEAAALPGAVRA